MKNYTILIAAVAAIGGLLFGFDTAVITGTLQYLRSYFQLSDSELGFVVASVAIGAIPGALFSGRLADLFGRKKMMLVTAILFLVSAAGSGLAGSYTALVIYRMIGGAAIGMASTLAPIYISEVAYPEYRGRLGMLQQLAIVLGILLSFISNYLIVTVSLPFLQEENYWRYMLGSEVFPAILFFLLLLLVPESPRWLILKDKIAKAKKVFGKIYTPDKAGEQVQLVLQDLTSAGPAKISDVFSSRYIKVVAIGLIFASIAHLTGINVIFYYAPLIFEQTRMGGSILFQTMLLGIANFLFTLIAFPLIDRLGRKKLLLIGSWAMAFGMFFIGWLFFTDNLQNYLVLITIFLYIGAFACTWGAVIWVYVAEIYPNKIRGTATSIAVFGNWTFNSIVAFTFPIMLSGLGPALTFFVYGFFNLGMVFFVSTFIFETKGVPLEKVEELYLMS